jgi:hypothetical protein
MRVLFILLFLPLALWAQNDLSFSPLKYDANRHLLSFNNELLPPWLHTVIDLSQDKLQYAFIMKASFTYPIEGWNEITQKLDYKKDLQNKEGYTPPSLFLKQGWFYSNAWPNMNLKGWFYSPEYHLFFNRKGIFELHHFFSNHLDAIKRLRMDAPNEVTLGEFVRIVIEPSQDILTVRPLLPSNWVKAYFKNIPLAQGKLIFVLTPYKEVSSDKDPQNLKFQIIFKNKKPQIITYKAFFSLQSQLLSNGIE